MKECPACRRCFPDEINHCPQDGVATTPSLLGETILDARYQLEKRLGQGGMGVVFKARHIFLKTSHAIKVILPDLVGNDPMLVTRFRQEALATAAIRHQNIIAVTDFGVVRGTMPFLVMEFVKGKSLQDILTEEKKMSPARALEFICAVGAGVSAAHRQNIVHRDLKPLNIMAQEGMTIAEGVKVLDFGLAKIKSRELLGSLVQAKTSGLIGSPFYMAPEQWSDEEPDSRADVYGLGIILYQMLSGDVPFKGTSIPSIMKKHLTQPPPSFKSVGVEISPRVEAAVFHALEKDVKARTPTVEAFLTELRAAVEAGGATIDMITEDLGDTILHPSAEAVTLQRPSFEPELPAKLPVAEKPPIYKRASMAVGVSLAVLVLAVAGTWYGLSPGTTPLSQPIKAETVAPVGPERSLTYWVTVQKMLKDNPLGAPFESAGDISYGTGWKFRFNFQPMQSGALYLLNVGPGKNGVEEYNVLVPSPRDRRPLRPDEKLDARLAANETVQLPLLGWFHITEQTGVEKLWIIWSAEPIPELDAIFSDAARNQKDRGVISNPDQIAHLQSYFKKYETSPPEAIADKLRKITSVKGRGDVLVNRVELSHEAY